MMELEGEITLHNFSASSFLLPTLPNTSIYIFEEKEEIPKASGIWIPRSYSSPNHFTHFFIPRI